MKIFSLTHLLASNVLVAYTLHTHKHARTRAHAHGHGHAHVCTFSTCEQMHMDMAQSWNHDTKKRSMSHIWIIPVTHINESCHAWAWVMLQIRMRHGTDMRSPGSHVDESCRTYQDISTSHITHLHESCHTYEWGMSHIWWSHVTNMWMNHDTHMNSSRPTKVWNMSPDSPAAALLLHQYTRASVHTYNFSYPWYIQNKSLPYVTCASQSFSIICIDIFMYLFISIE